MFPLYTLSPPKERARLLRRRTRRLFFRGIKSLDRQQQQQQQQQQQRRRKGSMSLKEFDEFK
jgi:hypothetical protein